MVNVVVIEPLGVAHVDAVRSLVQEPHAARMLFHATRPSREHIERCLSSLEDERREHRVYSFAIHVKALGYVGICRLDRDDHRPTVGELGYFIGTPFRGQSYATAAAALTLDGAFARGWFDAIEARCSPTNRASLKVLGKLGFVQVERCAGRRAKILVFERRMHPARAREDTSGTPATSQEIGGEECSSISSV